MLSLSQGQAKYMVRTHTSTGGLHGQHWPSLAADIMLLLLLLLHAGSPMQPTQNHTMQCRCCYCCCCCWC
jgi:hypothetical protein